ncbi:restriction endonuclease subunit S [Adlercreutzia sp. ZJ154]|uniref:restriction endonuclease subunit S n=1 Tax=Adlercreutzia sp. ZJ154 TaxID=2709790 RepID=UPI0013EC2BC5|nr:restriction endonuclease subunit S [Adlercreutzia sp. ZJ154]
MFDNKVTIEYASVSMPMNEDFYEQVIIEHLRDEHGYEYLHGPDVPRTTPDYCDVFLPAVLPSSLKRINPSLPADDSLPYKSNGGALKETDYGIIPESWECMPMGGFLTVRTDKVGDREDIPVYSTTNNGVFPRSEKFNKALSSSNSKNKIIEQGDIVFGMSREIFNFGVMKEAIGSVSPAYHVYYVNEQIINAEFLEIFMRYCPDYFRSLIRPGTREGQVLDKAELANRPVMIPPLALQTAFVLIRTQLADSVMNLTKVEN